MLKAGIIKGSKQKQKRLLPDTGFFFNECCIILPVVVLHYPDTSLFESPCSVVIFSNGGNGNDLSCAIPFAAMQLHKQMVKKNLHVERLSILLKLHLVFRDTPP